MPLVQRVTRRTLDTARVLAPRGDHRSGSGVPRTNMPLQMSLNARLITFNSHRIRTRVESREKYALTVHQGSAAHIIRSRKGKMLKFRWERGDFLVAARAGRRRGNRRTGQFHYFARVRHPGNKRPVRYLTTPLMMFGRMDNFRVTIKRTVNRSRLP